MSWRIGKANFLQNEFFAEFIFFVNSANIRSENNVISFSCAGVLGRDLSSTVPYPPPPQPLAWWVLILMTTKNQVSAEITPCANTDIGETIVYFLNRLSGYKHSDFADFWRVHLTSLIQKVKLDAPLYWRCHKAERNILSPLCLFVKTPIAY